MVKDHATVWESCLQNIRNNVNMQAFRTWFEPIKPIRLDGNALTIQVPNKYFYEWLEEHYVSLLKTSIRSQLGDKARLEYQILVNDPREEEKRKPYAGNGNGFEKPSSSHHGNVSLSDQLPYYNNVDTDSIKNPFVIPGIKKMKVDPQLNPNYRFDNYIEGDCNRLARSAGYAISRKPGQTSFNPLVIFGNVGLGKTHLAQAIGNEILDRLCHEASTLDVLYPLRPNRQVYERA
jgi:chromosomal replication initiator protein